MKTRLFSFTALLLVLCFAAFVSCTKDGNVDEDKAPSLGYSDADYFAGQFVRFNTLCCNQTGVQERLMRKQILTVSTTYFKNQF